MSRIGKMPIAIPAGVTVDIAENNKVTVKGPKGTLERVMAPEMEIKVEGAEVTVSRPNDLKRNKSLHGLTRTLINNMVVGVTNGYEKKLEVNGVGYRAAKQGKKLTLSLGYSHPVEMEDPEGSCADFLAHVRSDIEQHGFGVIDQALDAFACEVRKDADYHCFVRNDSEEGSRPVGAVTSTERNLVAGLDAHELEGKMQTLNLASQVGVVVAIDAIEIRQCEVIPTAAHGVL